MDRVRRLDPERQKRVLAYVQTLGDSDRSQSEWLDEAKALFPKVNSSLDKAAKKKIIKPNTAHRKISRLNRMLNK